MVFTFNKKTAEIEQEIYKQPKVRPSLVLRERSSSNSRLNIASMSLMAASSGS